VRPQVSEHVGFVDAGELAIPEHGLSGDQNRLHTRGLPTMHPASMIDVPASR